MMKYFILLVLLFTVSASAQYTKNDKQLAATTFTRNFDKVTTTEYLKSTDDKKVIAGLLSVSQSEDTSYVPAIISLPINKFPNEVCFALGQLGYAYNSVQYLKKAFSTENPDPLVKYYALIALGKIADSTFAQELVNQYNNTESRSGFNGISLALYYLTTNGKITADKVRPILENELHSSSSRQFEAAFCLYRIGPVRNEKELLVKVLKRILEGRVISSVTEKPAAYLFACLRKLQFFPDDPELIEKVKDTNDFQAQVEAVRAFSYYNFKTEREIDLFLGFLKNDNKNISREAAVSVRNLNLHGVLRDYLYLKISEKLHQDKDMEKYTHGELLISYLDLFPEDFDDVLLKYLNDKVSPEYAYKICSLYPGSAEALKILTDKYYQETLPDKLTILESLFNFSQENPEVKQILLSALSSDQAPLIALAAEGIDSTFISSHEDTLVNIVAASVSKHLNDPDYIESLILLEKAAGRISADLQQEVIGYLSNSELYSIKKFIAGLEGKSIRTISKDIDDFNKYWSKAFEYHEAEVVTDKGAFTISFLPEYAPVTVGSFCSLAETKFFKGIPFHRVVPGFVIQGGDPTGTGWGGPGYEIVSEFSPFNFSKGTVGMASSGKDTEGSQWFVTTGNYPHLDGRYTIFAEVLKGMDTVDNITQGTKILKINLIR
jgi:cyclophilin family peptidyl-prolyl cis-trans isomerase